MTDADGNVNCISMVSSSRIKFPFILINSSEMKVNLGGEVPRSYYFSGKPDTSYKKSLTISSGNKEHLEFKVENEGDVLK